MYVTSEYIVMNVYVSMYVNVHVVRLSACKRVLLSPGRNLLIEHVVYSAVKGALTKSYVRN